MDNDISRALQQRVRDARTALRIVGGDTKAFMGRKPHGERLEVGGHRGIVNYEPVELVLTARAGTSLEEIEDALAEHGQILAFEPPHFGAAATLGGTIAAGLSGPRRPYSGAARDFVLGCSVLNGRGDIMRFGGEVMKNVAGYDVSRLMTGALGTLGVLLEVSLKVLPKPADEITLVREHDSPEALRLLNEWAGRPLPLSASCHDGRRLYVRLSGAAAAVAAARGELGGEVLDDADAFWASVREQWHAFFRLDGPLWRLALPPAAPSPELPGEWLIEWGGAQRWLKSEAPPETVWRAAAQAGGHAGLFRGGDRNGEVCAPLADPLMALHRRLKQAFDPDGILNPGRMYANL